MKEYTQPRLRSLGTLSGLTLGNMGSCPDGNTDVDQYGGGFENFCEGSPSDK